MSTVQSILELTPLPQRPKKRPSFSLVSWFQASSPTQLRATSVSSFKELIQDDYLNVGLERANLTFREFSFQNDDGSFTNILLEHMIALQ